MRIFLPNHAANERVGMYVTPGKDRASDPAEWFNGKGEPESVAVEFRFGEADVPDPLGKFMVEGGYAQKTALLLPASARSKKRRE